MGEKAPAIPWGDFDWSYHQLSSLQSVFGPLGLMRKSQGADWEWADGAAVRYLNWKAREPKSWNDAAVIEDDSGSWTSVSGKGFGTPQRYVCQYTPGVFKCEDKGTGCATTKQ